MSFIKENSKLLILIVIIAIIGGGSYYFTSILPPQLENIQILEDENEVKRQELQFLEQKLLELPQMKQELNEMLMETQALKNRIPHHQVSATIMMEIVRYMDAYNFKDTHVIIGESTKQGDEESIYKTIPMTIQYTASYDDAVKLLEEIKRSYHMVIVDYFSVDNSIQEENEKDGNGTVAGDFVKAEILLSLHYIDGEEKEEYPNFMEFSKTSENIFLRPDLEEAKQANQAANQERDMARSNERAKDATRFEMYLTDIFRSGDNYSFSGYSPGKDPVYLGLTSEKDTKIILTVRGNGYTCLIEDSAGKKSEKQMEVNVTDPSLHITSQIQKVAEDMPNVKIQIRNYTPHVINVNLRGSLLENILIYNEDNKIVPSGRQVGKVALNI